MKQILTQKLKLEKTSREKKTQQRFSGVSINNKGKQVQFIYSVNKNINSILKQQKNLARLAYIQTRKKLFS